MAYKIIIFLYFYNYILSDKVGNFEFLIIVYKKNLISKRLTA